MARLPQPGSDSGAWGNILNDYLSQIHNSDGTLKNDSVTNAAIAPGAVTTTEIATDAVGATQIADGSITETLLASAVQTKLNAGGGTPDWSTITNKPAVIAAGADQAAARTAIGAGTSNLVIGTSGSTAKAGDYQPTALNISDSTAVGRTLITAGDAASARASIGAGTSSLVLGTSSSTAKAGDYQPTALNISDSTAVGRNVLTAADAAAARATIGAGTSNLAIGTSSSTAKAGDYQPTAANISDSTATGRSLLTATDATAARTAIGAASSTGLAPLASPALTGTPTVNTFNILTKSVTSVTTTTTLGAQASNEYIYLLGSGAIATLPTTVSNTCIYVLKNVHTADLTILTTSSQTIEGAPTYVLTPNESITIVSDNANWRII